MAEIELNHVIYVPACKAVFGPFSSEDHARLWAVSGLRGAEGKQPLEHVIVRYVDLLKDENPRVRTV